MAKKQKTVTKKEELIVQKEEPVVEKVEHVEPKTQPIGNALTAFILASVGAIFSITAILSLPGMVIGIVGLAFSKKCEEVTRRPFVAFKRVARPLSIAAIAVGAAMSTLITLALIGVGIYLIIKNGIAK